MLVSFIYFFFWLRCLRRFRWFYQLRPRNCCTALKILKYAKSYVGHFIILKLKKLFKKNIFFSRYFKFMMEINSVSEKTENSLLFPRASIFHKWQSLKSVLGFMYEIFLTLFVFNRNNFKSHSATMKLIFNIFIVNHSCIMKCIKYSTSFNFNVKSENDFKDYWTLKIKFKILGPLKMKF